MRKKHKKHKKEVTTDNSDKIAGYAMAMHHVTALSGNQLRQILREEAVGNNDNSRFAPGLAINNAMLAALTGEIILKAWIGKAKGQYPATHDLKCLAEELPDEAWQSFSEKEKKQIWETFEKHRKDFTDWRYLFEKREKSKGNQAPDNRILWATGRLIEEYRRQAIEQSVPGSELDNSN